MTTKIQSKLPNGFKEVISYEVEFDSEEFCGGFTGGEIVAQSYTIKIEPASPRGWQFSRHAFSGDKYIGEGLVNALAEPDDVFPTLEAVRQRIDQYIAEQAEEAVRRKAVTDARVASHRAYLAAMEQWKQEQLDQAEMVPVEELNSCDAIVATGSGRSDPAIWEKFNVYERYKRTPDWMWNSLPQIQYVIEFGVARHGHAPIKRYKKPNTKHKAVRKFTYPRPQKPTRAELEADLAMLRAKVGDS